MIITRAYLFTLNLTLDISFVVILLHMKMCYFTDVERIEKPQPRVKHYEVDQVRRYMREKQCERSKTIKELQKKQEQEKTVRSERMKVSGIFINES